MSNLITQRATSSKQQTASNFKNEIEGNLFGDLKDKLGISLITQGLVDPDIVIKAANLKDKSGGKSIDNRKRRSLAQILVNDFNIDHDITFGNVASVYGFREIQLTNEILDENRIQFIKYRMDSLEQTTRDYLISNKILPLRYDSRQPNKLIFISCDPTDRLISVAAREMKLLSFEVCYVKLNSMTQIIETIFPPENEFLRDLADTEFDFTDDELKDDEIDDILIDAEINKSMLFNLAEGMLVEAVRLGASDIHIVPTSSTSTEIMFRIDGMLQSWHTQENTRPEAIAAVIKDRAKNVDRFEREKPQDGFIQRKVDGHMIRFRFSAVPIVGREYQYKFESLVIRILDDRQVINDLDKLGLNGSARESFTKAIKQPQGLIIITGPTGSGKSTTLFAALNQIVRPEINVLSVEDPVEYIIPGVRQLKIGHKMNFEAALRAILRHDPDVIMLGEIRDKETGDTAIKLANTGHLTFSTLHTNDAPSAVSRLYKMGIETFLIAYAINIVVAQRLMRKLCENCKSPKADLTIAETRILGFSDEEYENTLFYEAVGCDKCAHGYKGRVAIHEALYFTKEIRQLIFESKHDINEEIIRQQAIKDGMKTLLMSARQRVIQGDSTLDEIARVVSVD